MLKDMFVWRKSVYDNNFKCNQCGAKLFNVKTSRPTDNLVVSGDDDLVNSKEPIYCYCGKCQNAVATWQSVEADAVDDENVLQGSYSEWIDKKAQDIGKELQKRVEGRLVSKYEQRIKMLEDKIKSKDATIKRLKMSYDTQLKEKDERLQMLYQELRHADAHIEKLQNEVEQYLKEKLGG